jgi:hypothetical protein
MQGFATQALAMIFNVPSYSDWLDTASYAETYRHHRRILQTLQWKYPGERWLLKSPDHIQGVESMLEVYPDGCLIHMHRDPVKCVPSWASLNAVFRGIHSQSIDPHELGRQALQRLATDLEHYRMQRQRCDTSRFIDIEYADLINEPMATIRRIYHWFDIELSAEAEERIQKFIARERTHKTTHHYSPEYFGMTPEQIRERFNPNSGMNGTPEK